MHNNNSLPQPVFVRGEKESRIALYHLENKPSSYPPVVMTHGTFSNASICRELAVFLQQQGFDCWIYEWSGHGKSAYGDFRPDAEDYALYDVPAVLKAVREKTKQEKCIWVAHSGGGFLPLMYMARDAHRQNQFQVIVSQGSQTTGAGKTMEQKFSIALVLLMIKLCGYMPGPLFGLGPEDERMGFMPQWCRWNKTRQWLGKDKFDYMQALQKIHIPALMIAGGNDKIAPPEGCRNLFDALGGKRKEFQLFSKKSGFAEDYNHPRLMASQNARQEIWPRILKFIKLHGRTG